MGQRATFRIFGGMAPLPPPIKLPMSRDLVQVGPTDSSVAMPGPVCFSLVRLAKRQNIRISIAS